LAVSSPVPPRAPPSFPTRRSPDLRRRRLLEELEPRFHQVLSSLTRGQLQGSLRYRSSFAPPAQDEGAVRDALAKALRDGLARDRGRKHTGVGPHADRLDFELSGRTARTFASQVQQRAILLARKSAEIENLEDHLVHQTPLLLDDGSAVL